MVRRELAQEAKDIEAKLVSIARETYETEGIEDEIEKALEKSIAFINADSSDRCEHIKETEEDPKLRTRYLLSENRRLARESSRLEDRVCSHIVDLKNGSLVSAKGPLPPSHTPEESALEAGKASLSYTLDREQLIPILEDLAAKQSASAEESAPVEDSVSNKRKLDSNLDSNSSPDKSNKRVKTDSESTGEAS